MGVEDQVQADLEPMAVVVARSEDVPGYQLGEVGVRACRELPEDLLRRAESFTSDGLRDFRLFRPKPVKSIIDGRGPLEAECRIGIEPAIARPAGTSHVSTAWSLVWQSLA